MKIHIVALAICPRCQSEVTEIADSGRVRPGPGIKVLTCILKSEFSFRDASILAAALDLSEPIANSPG